MSDKLYKVLVNGRSCHGSDMEWSLPKTTKAGKVTPGKWHSVKLPLKNCVNGFHLTKDPSKWIQDNMSVFEVEIGGESLPYDDFMGKVCVQKVRLTRQLNNEEILELFNLLIVSEGYHTINSGVCVAFGSATVTAYNSATVTAYDSATVTAFGSAIVRAFGSAIVTASDSATVTASDSTIVTASGSALVSARGTYSDNVSVSATDNACFVDYRSGKPII